MQTLSLCPCMQTLILGSVPSDQLRAGDTDPSQEPLVFLLSSSSTKHAAEKPPLVPFLPSGSLVPGMPAACLSYCQVMPYRFHVVPRTGQGVGEASAVFEAPRSIQYFVFICPP